MKKTIFAALSLLLVILAVATGFEGAKGSEFAYQYVYSQWWFKLLWAVLTACGIAAIWKRRLWHNIPALLLHASFVVILAGALITSVWGTRDMMHLREGQNSGTALPFTMHLKQFRLITYPGTDMPQGYESDIVCTDNGTSETATISMNNIFQHGGYRFYQSSYDPDMKGTVLTVAYDPWGIGVTYVGYALLLLSVLWLLLAPNGRYRRLLKRGISKGVFTLAILLCLSTQASLAHPGLLPMPQKEAPKGKPIVKEDMAQALARKQVMYNDRVVPMRTLALDFCQKVTGKRSFHGMSAEQFMLSIYLYRDAWIHLPIIKVEDEALRHHLGLKEKDGKVVEFFTKDQKYRLSDLYTQANNTNDESMRKAIEKVDERCTLVMMLLNDELLKPVPKGVEQMSEGKVSLELLYDALPWSMVLFVFTILVTAALLLVLFVKRLRRLSLPLNILVLVDFAALTSLYIIRWILQGHVPLSNGYETMLFIALVAIVLATLISWRAPKQVRLLPVLSLLVTSFTLLVSHLSFMSPEMTPLVPVLQSPWLSIHVSIVMISYALFAIMTLLSIAALIKPSEELTLTCQLLHTPATFLLAVGIFIGAVWANVSWGTYWSWDPKETWALITMMIYAIPLHGASLPSLQKPRNYHLFMLLAFLSVLMTYFGVNYILGGMHSYA